METQSRESAPAKSHMPYTWKQNVSMVKKNYHQKVVST